MDTLVRLMHLLPDAAATLTAHRGAVTEIRLRSNRPVQLVWQGGEALCGVPIKAERLREIVAALMDYSFYARESELAQGFFTMDDGCRVGVCGRFTGEGRMTDIGSACIRIAREKKGCADRLMGSIVTERGLYSLLLLSPPGMGKTTLLRDAARQLSESGFRVGVADERHELAACRMGVPTLDVGPRTDVVDGCDKPSAIRLLLRSMAPDVIVADEIGGEGDARALADASRCGAAVLVSAHAGSIQDAMRRPCLREVMELGSVDVVALLGGSPGHIAEVHSLRKGELAWKRA